MAHLYFTGDRSATGFCLPFMTDESPAICATTYDMSMKFGMQVHNNKCISTAG